MAIDSPGLGAMPPSDFGIFDACEMPPGVYDTDVVLGEGVVENPGIVQVRCIISTAKED